MRREVRKEKKRRRKKEEEKREERNNRSYTANSNNGIAWLFLSYCASFFFREQ